MSPLVILAAALAHALKGERLFVDAKSIVVFLLLAVLAFIGVFFERDFQHNLSLHRDLVIPVLTFTLLVSMALAREEVLTLAKLFVLVGAASAILGLVQHYTGQFLWLLRPEDAWWQSYKTGYIRASFLGRWLGTGNTLPSGLFATTNTFASYLVIPAVTAFALGWMPRADRQSRLLWRACFVVLVAALVLTFSRGSILTFLIACLLPLTLRRRQAVSFKKLVLAGAVGLLLVALILVSGLLAWDALGTVRGRGTMIQAGLDLLRDHPEALLTGGYTEDYLAEYYHAQLVHNILLYLLIQYGAGAMLVWFGIVLAGLRRTLLVARSSDLEARAVALALLGGIGATVFVYAQTTSFIDHTLSGMWLFFWLAIGTQLHRVVRGPVPVLITHPRPAPTAASFDAPLGAGPPP